MSASRRDRDRAEAEDRIERVLEAIDDSVFERRPVPDLADIACLSASRFQRVFRSIVGESPAAFLRRRKLAACARILSGGPEESITRLALDAGFESPSDFSRAFRRAYGSSPSAFRTEYRSRPFPGADSPSLGRRIAESVDAHARKERMEDLLVAALPSLGLDPHRRPGAMRARYARLYRALLADGLLHPNALVLGIVMDHPLALPLDRCRHLAAISVEPGAGAGEGYRIRRIRCEGDYVRCPVPGGREPAWMRFMSCARRLHDSWMPQQGLEPDCRPLMELHADLSEPRGSRWEIWVPVRSGRHGPYPRS